MLLFRWLVTLAAGYPVAWRTRRGELGLPEDQRKIDQRPTGTAVDCRVDVVINNLRVVNLEVVNLEVVVACAPTLNQP